MRRRTLGALRLVREASFPAPDHYALPNCASPSAVARYLAPYAERELAETFWVIALTTQHRVISGEPIAVSRGVLNSTLVHPREVFRAAIVAGAASIIVAHNHPSGLTDPSADDRTLTDQLAAAGRLLDIPVLDHLILGAAGRYTSFAEQGLL